MPFLSTVRRHVFCLALLAALMLVHGSARAQASEPTLLLFEVRVDEHVVAEAMSAYRAGDTIYFPLEELSRLIGIGIQTDAQRGTASGFVLNQSRRFSLNVSSGRYTLGTESGVADAGDMLLHDEDIYVSPKLLERWLPLDMDIELSRLLLRLRPLEKLPLQARQQREQRAAQLRRQRSEEQLAYARHPLPYRLFDVPFLDQTFSLNAHHHEQGSDLDGQYTLFATGDMLGMEGSLYFSHHSELASPDARLTLARHDPEARLLGPLQARSVELGSIVQPGIAHVSLASESGYGIRITNRPLTHPLNFNRHSLQGDLPPGWDVELYFNAALVGLQRANADGRYRFDDLPLIFGANEFRLVFYGPLGQVRVERRQILLEPSIVRPGEFFYSLAEQHDDGGGRRASLQFDAGLGASLVATGGVSTLPMGDDQQHYANLGIRRFWKNFVFSGEFAASDAGGSLGELGFRTRIGDLGLEISRTQLDDFVSELFPSNDDPIRSRDLLRLDGSVVALPRLSLALQARQDRLQSGNRERDVSLRLSTTVLNTALSHTLRWWQFGENSETQGIFQFSRRVADIGLTGQVGYLIEPRGEVTDAVLTADKSLGHGYHLNLGVARRYAEQNTYYTLGLTKALGRFGLRLNASHTRTGASTLGLQLFIGMGREPRQQRWRTDAQPLAHTGAASVQVFLDRNQNGIRDDADQPIEDVGFRVRGSNHPVRTDTQGIALLHPLPTRRTVDIELETGTLLDPQWIAQTQGVQLLPRPGRVAEIDMPVIRATEVTGTVYLSDGRQRRGIGDAVVELVNRHGDIVAETRSAVDGVYVIPNVGAGNYTLRISPAQLQRLKLEATPARQITVTRDADPVGNQDFMVKAAQ